MTLAKALLGTIGNHLLPTVTRTLAARQNVSFSQSVTLGAASPDRLIVLSITDQSNNKTWAPTLGGQSPDFSSPFVSSGDHFSVWKFPDGTSDTMVSNASSGQTGGVTVYSITGWDGFVVFDNQSFFGGDSQDFNSTVPVPLPENTLLMGAWSTNEDGSAELKQWDFGVAGRFFASGGSGDDGSAFELLAAPDASLSINCDSSGKRRAYGFLALGSGNLN